MEQGWVWDLDDFTVNQFGHPYQGNNYFNAGRANGLSFYESAAMTAFGSGTWEYFGETNHASLNDFINTTLGGIALGEMFHRAAWLMRDTHETGERAAVERDRRHGARPDHRATTGSSSGDASRVTTSPPRWCHRRSARLRSLGVLWRGTDTNAFDGDRPTISRSGSALRRPRGGRTRDAVRRVRRHASASAAAAAISEARVRGRLLGQPLNDGGLQFSVAPELRLREERRLPTGVAVVRGVRSAGPTMFASQDRSCVLGWGGLTVLGAIDSLPLGVEATARGGGRGGRRPGRVRRSAVLRLRAGRELRRRRRSSPAADGRSRIFNYEGRHIYSLDGVRANHFLQGPRFDLLVPLEGRLGIGAAAEYFESQELLPGPRSHGEGIQLSPGPHLLHVEPAMMRQLPLSSSSARSPAS